jgi:hypothetical protein
MPGLFYSEMLGIDKISFSNQHSQKKFSICDTGHLKSKFFKIEIHVNHRYLLFVTSVQYWPWCCEHEGLAIHRSLLCRPQ